MGARGQDQPRHAGAQRLLHRPGQGGPGGHERAGPVRGQGRPCQRHPRPGRRGAQVPGRAAGLCLLLK